MMMVIIILIKLLLPGGNKCNYNITMKISVVKNMWQEFVENCFGGINYFMGKVSIYFTLSGKHF